MTVRRVSSAPVWKRSQSVQRFGPERVGLCFPRVAAGAAVERHHVGAVGHPRRNRVGFTGGALRQGHRLPLFSPRPLAVHISRFWEQPSGPVPPPGCGPPELAGRIDSFLAAARPASFPLRIFCNAHEAVGKLGDLARVLRQLLATHRASFNRPCASTNLAEVSINSVKRVAHRFGIRFLLSACKPPPAPHSEADGCEDYAGSPPRSPARIGPAATRARSSSPIRSYTPAICGFRRRINDSLRLHGPSSGPCLVHSGRTPRFHSAIPGPRASNDQRAKLLRFTRGCLCCRCVFVVDWTT
jgi:hypothetical protein